MADRSSWHYERGTLRGAATLNAYVRMEERKVYSVQLTFCPVQAHIDSLFPVTSRSFARTWTWGSLITKLRYGHELERPASSGGNFGPHAFRASHPLTCEFHTSRPESRFCFTPHVLQACMLHTTHPASSTPHVLQAFTLHTIRSASFTTHILQL